MNIKDLPTDQEIFYELGEIPGTTNIIHYQGQVKYIHYNIPDDHLNASVAEISRLYFSS
ncbi:predicted ORF [Xanthomonas phage XacN1]|nr:predicted ORF [Xanthomonas phage XacN1]